MLPRWYPNVIDNADGNFIQNHIECIAKNNKVVVLFVKGIKKVPEKDIGRPDKKNIENNIIYYKSNNSFFSFLINPIRHFLLLNRTFKNIEKRHGKARMSHVHVVGRNGLFAFYLQYKHRIPYVVSEHWSAMLPESPKLSFLRKFAYKTVYKHAAAISSVSESLKKGIQGIYAKISIDIIPNVINEAFLTHPIQAEKKSIKKLVHISNLSTDIKQSDKMMQYLEEIAANRDDFELVLIGDGKDKPKLEQLGKNLKHLSERLSFTGDILPEEVADILSQAHATISFSKFETQSIVLLESIAMGVPIVAPLVGGIPEHCTNRGILFPVNSKASFIQSIETILDDNKSVIKAPMRTYIESSFSCDSINSKFNQFYLKVSTDVQ